MTNYGILEVENRARSYDYGRFARWLGSTSRSPRGDISTVKVESFSWPDGITFWALLLMGRVGSRFDNALVESF